MSVNLPELLAPAGGAACLNAAVRAGADAVYLGLDKFNARQNADNFTLRTLEEACIYAHARGVKIYVTANTLILPDEMDDALRLVCRAYEKGADAFIVQDLGLAAHIATLMPREALHISTQMNIHSEAGMEAAAELGAARVTLARELSVGEIAHLSEVGRRLGVECEVFAHGALCVCYSGQCLMSSMIGGRSANRGVCAQACRLPYHLVHRERPDQELKSPGEFLLSPKDLCTAERLDELAAAGAASLKIEGRMKSAEYVFAVVSVYRRALDRLRSAHEEAASEGAVPGTGPFLHGATSLPSEDRETLGSVFSRGFTDAYLDGQRADELMSWQRPNNRGQFAGRVKRADEHEVSFVPEVELASGDLLEAWTRRGNVRFPVPEDAVLGKRLATIPLSGERIPVNAGDRIFRIRSAQAAFAEDDREPRIPVIGRVRLVKGEPVQMAFRPGCLFGREIPPVEGSSQGSDVEAARTRAVTEDDVREHVGRMGATPFSLEELHVELDPDVGIGFSELHRVRARALEELERALSKAANPQRSASSTAPEPERRAPGADLSERECAICALCTSPETARAAKRSGADAIYVPAHNYQRGGAQISGCAVREASQAGYPKGCVLVMPSVEHDARGTSAEAKHGLDAWKNVSAGDAILVESLGSLERGAALGCRMEVGASLPLMNGDALFVAQAFGAEGAWLSPELDLSQIRALARTSPLPLGIKVYGAQELMVCEHCLLSVQGACSEECATCTRRTVPFGLKDRKDYVFPVVTDVAGRSHVYNSVTCDIADALPELIGCGLTRFLVDATLMDVEQTAQAVGRIRHGIERAREGASIPKMPNTTSGHLHRPL